MQIFSKVDDGSNRAFFFFFLKKRLAQNFCISLQYELQYVNYLKTKIDLHTFDILVGNCSSERSYGISEIS